MKNTEKPIKNKKLKKNNVFLIILIVIAIFAISAILYYQGNYDAQKDAAKAPSYVIDEEYESLYQEFENKTSTFPVVSQCLDRPPADMLFCVAVVLRDESYCDRIIFGDQSYKSTICKSQLQDNVELCDELNSSNRDLCYFDYSINKNDESVCNQIVDPDKNSACQGILKQEPEMCSNIESEEYKFLCIVNIAALTGNKELCEQLMNKEQCYADLGYP